ncbi:MAG: hypothetical protein IJ480_12290 [Clostridia bacterium]|nr:hypothetical protein [Clostridia bacterium]
MSKSRPNGQPPKKQTQTPAAPPKSPAEKMRDRYIFACVALILYVMPAVTCLGMVYATGGSLQNMVTGMIVSVLAVPLGLLGMFFYKKQKGRMLMGALCVLLCGGHIVSAVLLGGWYLMMAPHFILILVCISGLKCIEQ